MNLISVWSVLVASIAAFAIDSVWYSPVLFGDEWMRLRGVAAPGANAPKRPMWGRYLGHFAAAVVLFAGLGFFIAQSGSIGAGDAMSVAAIAWLGFSATAAARKMIWEGAPFKLILIEEVGALVVWVVGAAIIGAMM